MLSCTSNKKRLNPGPGGMHIMIGAYNTQLLVQSVRMPVPQLTTASHTPVNMYISICAFPLSNREEHYWPYKLLYMFFISKNLLISGFNLQVPFLLLRWLCTSSTASTEDIGLHSTLCTVSCHISNSNNKVENTFTRNTRPHALSKTAYWYLALYKTFLQTTHIWQA